MKSNFIKVIECFEVKGLGLITEIQHLESGIPPNTLVFNLESNESWIVEKRIFSGVLLRTNSEKYFDNETEFMHIDDFFGKPIEIARNEVLSKRENGIYLYLLKAINKKQTMKPEKGSLLKIARNHNII